MPSFSTQSSIEARISSTRLATYIDFDKDGTPDAASLASGIAFSGAYVAGRLESRYGQTVIDTWDLDQGGTPPDLVGKLSDDLCIWQYAVSKPNLYADNQEIKDNVDDMLDKIANFEISIYGASEPVVDEFITERSKSDFDPERDVDNLTVNPNWILPDPRKLEDYPE